jgi:hypothetical protein
VVVIIAVLVLVRFGLGLKLGTLFGSLPGDIAYTSGSTSFYSPMASCFIMSIAFSFFGNMFAGGGGGGGGDGTR